MNRFLTPLTNAIIERKRTVDKYIGDAIMAFWNAPLDDPQQESNACEAALEMLARAEELNQEFKSEADRNGGKYMPLKVGIGLNTGRAWWGIWGPTSVSTTPCWATRSMSPRGWRRARYRIPIVTDRTTGKR